MAIAQSTSNRHQAKQGTASQNDKYIAHSDSTIGNAEALDKEGKEGAIALSAAQHRLLIQK